MNPELPSSPTSLPKKPRTGVTRYDPEFALLICERIATTPQSLVKICQAPDMPGVATIFRWAREHPDFREMYVMAKETQAEVLLEECLDLVDDDSKDVIHLPDGKIVFNRLALQRCKMKVEHRRWMASKLLPRKYGPHHREKSSTSTSSTPYEDPAQEGIITEEYRMQLVAERRKVMEAGMATAAAAEAAAAAAAHKHHRHPHPRTPNSESPDLRSSNPPPHLPPPSSDPLSPSTPYRPLTPAPTPPRSPTGHNPKRWYDIIDPSLKKSYRERTKTINRAVS